MLAEDPADGVSALGAHRQARRASVRSADRLPLARQHTDVRCARALAAYRIRRDHYRGMSEEQRASYVEAQAAQAAAKTAAKAAEKAADVKHAETIAAQARLAAQYEAAAAKRAAEERVAFNAVLAHQRQEHAARKAADPRGAISDAFFAKFGTSDR
jgi:hypothetical protein